MLKFRNLDVDPADPVTTWGVEGVLTAIDRGGLADWRRISRAVREDPWGTVGADLDQALDLAESTGVAAALRENLVRARMSEAERLGRKIAEYVRRSGRSQAQFARDVGTSPSRMSTYVTGQVVPSGVLLERMRRLARRPFFDV